MADLSYERPTMVELGSFAELTRYRKWWHGWDHYWGGYWRRRRRHHPW